MNAFFVIKNKTGLLLQIFQNIQKHALKALIPDIRLNFVLCCCTYSNSLHLYLCLLLCYYCSLFQYFHAYVTCDINAP